MREKNRRDRVTLCNYPTSECESGCCHWAGCHLCSAEPGREMETRTCQEQGALSLICPNYKEEKGACWSPELSPWIRDPLSMGSWGWEHVWPYSPKVNWKDSHLTSVRTVSVWNAEVRHSWCVSGGPQRWVAGEACSPHCDAAMRGPSPCCGPRARGCMPANAA